MKVLFPSRSIGTTRAEKYIDPDISSFLLKAWQVAGVTLFSKIF